MSTEGSVPVTPPRTTEETPNLSKLSDVSAASDTVWHDASGGNSPPPKMPDSSDNDESSQYLDMDAITGPSVASAREASESSTEGYDLTAILGPGEAKSRVAVSDAEDSTKDGSSHPEASVKEVSQNEGSMNEGGSAVIEEYAAGEGPPHDMQGSVQSMGSTYEEIVEESENTLEEIIEDDETLEEEVVDDDTLEEEIVEEEEIEEVNHEEEQEEDESFEDGVDILPVVAEVDEEAMEDSTSRTEEPNTVEETPAPTSPVAAPPKTDSPEDFVTPLQEVAPGSPVRNLEDEGGQALSPSMLPPEGADSPVKYGRDVPIAPTRSFDSQSSTPPSSPSRSAKAAATVAPGTLPDQPPLTVDSVQEDPEKNRAAGVAVAGAVIGGGTATAVIASNNDDVQESDSGAAATVAPGTLSDQPPLRDDGDQEDPEKNRAAGVAAAAAVIGGGTVAAAMTSNKDDVQASDAPASPATGSPSVPVAVSQNAPVPFEEEEPTDEGTYRVDEVAQLAGDELSADTETTEPMANRGIVSDDGGALGTGPTDDIEEDYILMEGADADEPISGEVEEEISVAPEEQDVVDSTEPSEGHEGAVAATAASNIGDEDDAPDTDNVRDIETGDNPDDVSASETKFLSEREEREKRNKVSAVLLYLCCIICLLLIAIAIILPLWLTDDSDEDRGGIVVPTQPPVPTPPPVPVPVTATPTLSPGKTAPPTPLETNAPTEILLKWEQLYGPLSGSPDSGFGLSVSFSGDLLVAGAPSTGAGEVRSFVVNQSGDMELQSIVAGEEEGSRFGEAVDLTGNVMIVGAPSVLAFGTPTEAGGAYVFEYRGESVGFVQVGSLVRGDEAGADANSELGSSVAVSVVGDKIRIAMGAPRSNLGAFLSGRVYTFERSLSADEEDWIPIGVSQIVGERSDDLFGSSLDMSNDGSTFLAGAPGSGDGNGYALGYMYEESAETPWSLVFAVNGKEAGEQMGSSVAILSDSGDTIAVGAPGFQNGAGRVQVFERGFSNIYEQLGSDIVGSPGDRLGEAGSLSGSRTIDVFSVVVGTRSGYVKRFDYNKGSNSWEEKYEALDTGFGNGVTSLTSSGSNYIAVSGGKDNAVSVYTAVPNDDKPPTGPAPVPVAAPVETVQPTLADPETFAPTFGNLIGWERIGGPFSVNLPTSGFGNMVALTDDLALVGVPFALSATGAVLVYAPDDSNEWVTTRELYGEQSSSGFGYALDTSGTSMAVGSPFLYAPGTSTPSGGVYVYDGDFALVGSVLLGDSSENEFFGAAVGISSTGVVVVGSPGNGGDALNGAFYVFRDAGSDWQLETSAIGDAGDSLGQAVDIDTEKGDLIVVGAPGNGAGYASFYENVNDQWIESFQANGETPGEEFGTSVKVLSSTMVAIGAPSYQGGRGRVVVYEKVDSTFQVVGTLVGEANDQLGLFGRVAGSGSSVIMGTADGRVRRFDLDGSTGNWIQITKVLDTTYGSSFKSLATGSSTGSFIVGGNLESSAYTLAI